MYQGIYQGRRGKRDASNLYYNNVVQSQVLKEGMKVKEEKKKRPLCLMPHGMVLVHLQLLLLLFPLTTRRREGILQLQLLQLRSEGGGTIVFEFLVRGIRWTILISSHHPPIMKMPSIQQLHSNNNPDNVECNCMIILIQCILRHASRMPKTQVSHHRISKYKFELLHPPTVRYS